MVKRQRIDRVIGETIREIGILVFVFAPLDSVFAEARLDAQSLRLTVSCALGLIVTGILMESEA